MHIFLTGFMGVGKTTIGKELAKLYSLPFVDLDQYIETEQGQSITSIFEQDGEAVFRKIEREALLQLIKNSTPNTIIALGGGTMASSSNHIDIIQNGVCIYLYLPWKEIEENIPNLKNRPLIESKTTAELKSLFDKREYFYALSQLKMPINSTFTAKKLAQTLRLSTNR